MKFVNFLTGRGQAGQSDRRALRQSHHPKTAMIAVLLLGLSLCGLASPALSSTHIYLYTSSAAQDVTSEIQTVNGHTYVMTDSPYEIVLDFNYGHVYDIDGFLIGYISTAPSPTP